MTTVYVVSSGSYSDYGINGIFSTPERAELYSAALPYSNGVDEWELDAMPSEIDRGLKHFEVVMQGDGDSEVTLYEPDAEREDARGYDYIGPNREFLPVWRFFVWAKDETHAVKVANERRVAMKASGAWEGGLSP